MNWPRNLIRDIFASGLPLLLTAMAWLPANSSVVNNPQKKYIITIDPGHGGKDPGAIGKNGVKEAHATLDIALRLRDALKNQGVKVEMTRTGDDFVPLYERTKMANKVGGKLFVSIHCNAARDRAANGQETFFLAQSKTERAMRVAKFENSVISLEEDQGKYAAMSDENLILITMAQSQFVQESEELAGIIQHDVPKAVGTKDRGVDQAGFYVLVGASMPAVLVETAFISNPGEEAELNTPKWRQRMADNLCKAILKFISAQQ